MKNRILFVCVGQAGGNIGELFYNKGYNVFLINSSYEDLKSSNVPEKFKHYIVGANGCSKEREKGLELAKENWQMLLELVESKFPQQDIVYFIFSSGGGTGSGLSPSMIEVLSKKKPNKNYGAVIILPSTKESLKSLANAVECMKHLKRIERLKCTFILDNNNDDKFKINERFVDEFDSLIKVTSESDSKGVIDKMELEKTLTSKGNSVIVKAEHNANLQEILNHYSNSIFTPWEQGCQYLAISITKDIDMEIIEHVFGTPWDRFVGYNEKYNLIFAVGMKMPTDRINELINTVNGRKNDVRMYDDNSFEFEVPILELPNNKAKEEERDEFDIDIEALFEKFAK